MINKNHFLPKLLVTVSIPTSHAQLIWHYHLFKLSNKKNNHAFGPFPYKRTDAMRKSVSLPFCLKDSYLRVVLPSSVHFSSCLALPRPVKSFFATPCRKKGGSAHPRTSKSPLQFAVKCCLGLFCLCQWRCGVSGFCNISLGCEALEM